MSTQQRPELFSPHSVTAMMAIVTAVIALGVGVWENVQMREHNRLSVTPHLQLTAEFRTDDTESVDRGLVRLTNEGVGPAVIDRVEVVLTDSDGAKQQFGSWGEVRPLMKDRYEIKLARRMELGPGVIIGADRTLELAIFEKSSTAAEPLFPALLKRLDFRVAYHSVYGDSFETDLRRQRAQAGV